MISLYKQNGVVNSGIMELTGLSTDIKPIDIFDGHSIPNGSIFFEMDTSNQYRYNSADKQWIKTVNGGSSSSGSDVFVIHLTGIVNASSEGEIEDYELSIKETKEELLQAYNEGKAFILLDQSINIYSGDQRYPNYETYPKGWITGWESWGESGTLTVPCVLLFEEEGQTGTDNWGFGYEIVFDTNPPKVFIQSF